VIKLLVELKKHNAKACSTPERHRPVYHVKEEAK
jgi:hypothetical protein